MRFDPIGTDAATACAALRHRRRKLRQWLAQLRRAPDDAFVRRFPAMVAAVEAGFRHEEALMDLLGDACVPPRLADHAIILCALHRTMSRVEDGDVALGRRVVDAMLAITSAPFPPGMPSPAPAPRRRHARCPPEQGNAEAGTAADGAIGERGRVFVRADAHRVATAPHASPRSAVIADRHGRAKRLKKR